MAIWNNKSCVNGHFDRIPSEVKQSKSPRMANATIVLLLFVVNLHIWALKVLLKALVAIEIHKFH